MEDRNNTRHLHHHTGAADAGGGASNGLALSLPLPPTTKLHPPPRSGTAGEAAAAGAAAVDPLERGGGGGRDDVWSQGATMTLIDAWGDRYLELNRGNLKQKHWKEVADAVNTRPSRNNKQPKTDVQCKNRLDTLKKKYKVEKTRIVTGAATKWALFNRMEDLIGPSGKHQHKQQHQHRSLSPLPPVTATPPSPEPVMPNATNNYRNHQQQHTESHNMTESWVNERRAQTQQNDYGVALKEVASAIVKFGKVYERIEGVKQQQMMDLEKQRMEFVKDLELQRMHLFMHTQLELAKIKHGNSTEHYL